MSRFTPKNASHTVSQPRGSTTLSKYYRYKTVSVHQRMPRMQPQVRLVESFTALPGKSAPHGAHQCFVDANMQDLGAHLLCKFATSARTALHAARRRTQPSPAATTRPVAGRAASASSSCATSSGPFGSVAPFRCAAVCSSCSSSPAASAGQRAVLRLIQGCTILWLNAGESLHHYHTCCKRHRVKQPHSCYVLNLTCISVNSSVTDSPI